MLLYCWRKGDRRGQVGHARVARKHAGGWCWADLVGPPDDEDHRKEDVRETQLNGAQLRSFEASGGSVEISQILLRVSRVGQALFLWHVQGRCCCEKLRVTTDQY